MKKMKFGLVLLLYLCTALQILAQEKRISLDVHDEPMLSVLKEVAQTGNQKISFSHEDIAPYKVTVTIRNKTIHEVLLQILQGTPLLFRERGEFITVYLDPKSPEAIKKKNYCTITGIVQDNTGEPLPGATVAITYDFKHWGSSTDINGNFTIHVPNAAMHSGKAVIKASFIGFTQMKSQVGKERTNYKFVLTPSENEINEVVVTGYGNIDARKKTSAITSLKMDDILMPGMTSIDQALEGRVPDMIFMQNSGEVGATARMRIRGTSTLVGNREPLWVLDGIPLSDPVDITTDQLNDPDYINYIGNAISGINPQDIDRVDILKDAAATALYGTRAANGVIVVTTKKGHIGAPSINYSGQLKLIVRPRYTDHNINLMNSQERIQFGKDLCDLHYAFPSNMTMVGYEGAYNSYLKGNINFDEFQNQVRFFENANTDWFKILSRDAWTHTHTVSASGGNENTRYYASLGYTGEDGVVKTQYNDRYTTSLNIQSNISQSLQINVRLNGNITKKNYLPDEINALDYAYNTTRALPCYNPDGSLYYYKRHAYNVGNNKDTDYYKYNYNIINEMENTSKTYNSNQLLAAFDLQYKYQQIFDVIATMAYQRSSSTTETWYGEKSNYVAQLKNGEVDDTPQKGEDGKCDLPYGGVLNTSNYITDNVTFRIQANYHQSLGSNKRHLLSSTLGYELNTFRNNGYNDQTRGYYKDRGMKYIESLTLEEVLEYPQYAKWLVTPHRNMVSEKTNKLSGYLTASYSYGDYFTVNMNGRFDASNKFGSRSNEKFLPIWSISGMFNAKETFLKDNERINDIRLRFSYGKTGNMVDGQTPNLLIKQGSMNVYYGENSSTVAYVNNRYAFPNPNLRWEQTDQYNIGIETSLFDSRLNVTSDIYYKKTKDAFTTVPISTVNGLSSFVMNGGDIMNKGFSISVNGYPIRSKEWRWYLSTSYSVVKNKVENDVINDYSIDNYLNGSAIIGGESIGTFYSYEFLGLNPKNGTPLFDDYSDRRHLLQNKNLEQVVKTVLVKSGTREPKFQGALYSTLTWKQLTLSTNFTYSLGNKIRKFNLYSDILSGVSSENNIRKDFTERWRVPGDEHRTDYPALISPSDPKYPDYTYHWSARNANLSTIKTFATSIWNMYDNSDIRVVSGNYLKLSQLSLRYRFKSEQLRKTPFNNLSVDFSTNNVFTICSRQLKGQDPSQSGFSASTVLSTRPTYTLGIQVTL